MAGRGAYQKKEQNKANLEAREKFLLDGIKAPVSVDKIARDAMIGQRAFAALDLPRLQITPLALNTIKSLSDEIFTHPDDAGRTGFEYLNALRIKLNECLAVVAVTRTSAAKAERVENQTKHLQARLTAVELQGIKRQRAYLSLYSALNGLILDRHMPVEAQQRLYIILEEHHAAFADLFDSNAPDPQVQQIFNAQGKPQ